MVPFFLFNNLWADSRRCQKQCMGLLWWEEKATTFKRWLCSDIYEPASSSNSEQVWPNRWLVSQPNTLPELEWKTRSEGPLNPIFSVSWGLCKYVSWGLCKWLYRYDKKNQRKSNLGEIYSFISLKCLPYRACSQIKIKKRKIAVVIITVASSN